MTVNDSVFEVYSTIKVGPWRALQMREISRVEYDSRLSETQRLLEEAQGHTDECGWWSDLNICDCGVNK